MKFCIHIHVRILTNGNLKSNQNKTFHRSETFSSYFYLYLNGNGNKMKRIKLNYNSVACERNAILKLFHNSLKAHNV